MSRKSRTPEEQSRGDKIWALLHESHVTSMEYIQNLFKETIAEFMENGLEQRWLTLLVMASMIIRTRTLTTAATRQEEPNQHQPGH